MAYFSSVADRARNRDPGHENVNSAGRSTRDRIVAATASLIAEVGWGAVTSRTVAARAGVKPGLIHYYFGSMDDLRRVTVAGRIFTFFQDRIGAVAAETDPGVGRVDPSGPHLWGSA